MAKATPHDFMQAFAGDAGRVLLGFPDMAADLVLGKVVDLNARHGREVESVVDAAIAGNALRIARSEVARSSLLAVLAGGCATAPLHASFEQWVEQETTGLPVQSRTPRHPRTKPSFERAKRTLDELFPDGIPDQVDLPNRILCRRVGLALEKGRGVSDDTILRAAGRRK
jgi:hypothetical protein